MFCSQTLWTFKASKDVKISTFLKRENGGDKDVNHDMDLKCFISQFVTLSKCLTLTKIQAKTWNGGEFQMNYLRNNVILPLISVFWIVTVPNIPWTQIFHTKNHSEE